MKPFRTVLLALLLMVPPAAVAVTEAVLRYPARFAEVVPGKVYRGGQPNARHVENLARDKGVKTIISLTDDLDKPPYSDEKRAAKALGVRLLHFSMPGDGCGDFGALDRAADALGTALRDPKQWPVFFHCNAGKQRSNALQAAYRMRVQGWTIDRALQELERDYGLDREEESKLAEHLRAYAKWLEASGNRGLRGAD